VPGVYGGLVARNRADSARHLLYFLFPRISFSARTVSRFHPHFGRWDSGIFKHCVSAGVSQHGRQATLCVCGIHNVSVKDERANGLSVVTTWATAVRAATDDAIPHSLKEGRGGRRRRAWHGATAGRGDIERAAAIQPFYLYYRVRDALLSRWRLYASLSRAYRRDNVLSLALVHRRSPASFTGRCWLDPPASMAYWRMAAWT